MSKEKSAEFIANEESASRSKLRDQDASEGRPTRRVVFSPPKQARKVFQTKSLTSFHPPTSLKLSSIALISVSNPIFSSSVPIFVTSHCCFPRSPFPVRRR